jgi:hypothetical protein
MADDLSGYFELAAQVIPVLLLALVVESGFLPQLPPSRDAPWPITGWWRPS